MVRGDIGKKDGKAWKGIPNLIQEKVELKFVKQASTKQGGLTSRVALDGVQVKSRNGVGGKGSFVRPGARRGNFSWSCTCHRVDVAIISRLEGETSKCRDQERGKRLKGSSRQLPPQRKQWMPELAQAQWQ